MLSRGFASHLLNVGLGVGMFVFEDITEAAGDDAREGMITNTRDHLSYRNDRTDFSQSVIYGVW